VGGAGILRDLHGVLLLVGGVRTDRFASAIGRSVLDLPIDDNQQSLLDWWIQECSTLADVAARPRLPLRVITNRTPPRPQPLAAISRIAFAVERDPAELRGTGGVLRDACQQYSDDTRVLVVTGARVLSGSLTAIAASLAAVDADLAMLAHSDGAPGGVMLIRCGCLREIAPIGFSDLHEQALPAIARRYRVRVVQRPAAFGGSLRTRADYISTLCALRKGLVALHRPNPFADQGFATFAIRESSAEVASDATLHDSVVLAGARVDPGAVVVRSVVCRGAIVRRGTTVVDRICGPEKSTRRFLLF
jgi:hypothetical protein